MTDLASLGIRVESQDVAQADGRLGSFAGASGRAERATDSLTASVQRSQMMVGLLNKAMGLLGVASLTAAFLGLRTATLEYSASLREVSTLVDAAKVSMDDLSRAALQQAGQFNSAPITQTQALYQIISAGASTAAQATETLTAANRLAVGGVTSVTIAADGLTSVLNAYGPKVEGATAVSDAMFVAMRAGKTTIAELSASLGQVSPLAAQVGVSFDELAAATAALTKGGISTSVATTGLRAILAAVAKPSSEAEKLAKALGLEFNATALATKGLSGFLDELAAKTGGNTDALALLFGGVEALVPVLALSGQAGQDFAAIMEDMAAKTGATGDAFDTVASGPAFQIGVIFSTLGANALGLGMTILDFLSPAISGLADVVTGAAKPHWALDVALKALAITAGVTVVRSLYAMIVPAVLASNTVRALALSIALVGPAATASAVATTALGAAINFALGPIGIAIAAVGLLTGAWVLLQTETRGAEREMRQAAATAGAGGQMYLQLRQEAEEAAKSQINVENAARGAAGGMVAASVQADTLKAKLTAMGIEAEWTAARLANLGVMRATDARNTALRRQQTNPNQRDGSQAVMSMDVTSANEELALARRVQVAAEERYATAVIGSQGRQAAAARAASAQSAAAAAAAAAAAVGADSASKARSQAEKDYDRLVKQAEKFVEALKEETAQIGLNSIQRKQVSVDMAAALAPTKALADAIRAEGQAWKERTEAFVRSEAIRAIVENTDRSRDQLRMMELERDLIGATNTERARQLAMLGAELDLRRQMADIKRQTGVDIDLVNSSEGQAAIGAAGANAATGVGNQQALTTYNLDLEYQLDLLRQIDDHANSVASGLAEAFGSAGQALGDLLTTMTGYQARLEGIAEAQRRYSEAVGAGNEDAQRMAMFERDRAQAQVQQYGDLASAAKGFFKEGSDGYRVMAAIEQAYRIQQMMGMMQSMIFGKQEAASSIAGSMAKGAASMAAGAAKMFESLGPWAFPVVAAMVGVLAGLGLRGGGGGGKGSSGPAANDNAPDATTAAVRGQTERQSAAQAGTLSSMAQQIKVAVEFDDPMFRARVQKETAPMVVQGGQVAAQVGQNRTEAALARRQAYTVRS